MNRKCRLNYKAAIYSQEQQDEYERDLLLKASGEKEYSLIDYKLYFSIREICLDGINGWSLSRFSGKNSHIIIPARLNGLPVLELDDRVFERCETIENVVLPKELLNINRHAFCLCPRLTSVTIPKSVKYINVGSFVANENLKEVIFLGTKQEWKNINKNLFWSYDEKNDSGFRWYDRVCFNSVKCSDGVIIRRNFKNY